MSRELVIDGNFLWSKNTSPNDWQVVRGVATDGWLRDTELISPVEAAAAAEWLLSRAISLPESDLAREILHCFGISRLTRKAEKHMRAAIDLVCTRGKAIREAERIVWTGQ